MDSHELKQLRKELGLSQAKMAKYLMVHLRTYQRWEQGQSRCRLTREQILVGIERWML
jgi:DNA-binding transcriptional regulator YiaG